jgi:LPS-assembly lipoprotein
MVLSIGSFLQKQLRVWMLLALALSLHACGFQLRGSIDLSSEMSPIYIEQNGVFDLAREIKTLLASNKIAMVESAQQSKSQLILLDDSKSQSVLSVDGSGQAREYLLSYKVNFVIKVNQKNKDKTAAVPDSLTINRSWLFDPNAVLAVTNEAELLYKDMRREAARLILLKINARSKNSTAGSTGR